MSSHLHKRRLWITASPQVGRWTILGLAPNRGHRSTVHARCACGAEHIIDLATIKLGRSTQCKACGKRRRKRKYD